MSIAYLSLGSNMGDRLENLVEAVRLLKADPKITEISCSPVFETEPVGYTEQDLFLNICVKIETKYSPVALLDKCQEIEQALHRVRKIHWGPRTIDLDILTFDDRKIDTKRLTIPHPRMEERGFVQVPLLFLSGETEIPEKWKTDVRYFGPMPDIDS